ncbi:MAG: terminase small subunit [Fusobacteriaceae bacterium]
MDKLSKEDLKLTNKELAKKYNTSERTIMRWKKKQQDSDTNNVTSNVTKKKNEKTINKNFYKKVDNSDLNARQKLFCVYYIQNFNATQAALKAGYSKSGAFVDGHRLLKNTNVKALLNELKELQFNELLLDSNKILIRHAQIAFSDMTDFLNDNGSLKKLSEVDGTLLKKIKIKDTEFGRDIIVELENREKSLDFLTKFKGLDLKTDIEEDSSRKLIIEVEDDK